MCATAVSGDGGVGCMGVWVSCMGMFTELLLKAIFFVRDDEDLE